jgi:ADP-L-glycero-D-manno-heptose 6-epimerase
MIVLTGGAGFIGSCFLRKLNDNGIDDIIVVDNLGLSDKWKNLVGKKFLRYYNKNEFIEILNHSHGINNGIDAIIHLGACSSTTERDADYIMYNNLNYSIDLATYAADNEIRFIYASSAATYGNGSAGYSDESIENLEPMNAYGLSKHLFDNWVIKNQLDQQFTGLKFFNVFGPNEYHKEDMASMIFKSYKQIKSYKKADLFRSNSKEFEDGNQMRDFIYVKDCIDIMINIFENKEFNGIYNLGTGKARTWNDLVKTVFQSLNIEPNINYIDMPDSLTEQYQNFTEADLKKFNHAYGEFKFTELENSITDYVTNYLEHKFKIL